jgi:hypothetical protein
MPKKYHKFDVFDKCEVCGVLRKKENIVGCGFNAKLTNMGRYLYSNDNGESYQKEFINCKL